MDKEDGRKLLREARRERRKQAVRLHGKGMEVKEITALLGLGHCVQCAKGSAGGRNQSLIAEADRARHRRAPPIVCSTGETHSAADLREPARAVEA
jgi:hypothetical protein